MIVGDSIVRADPEICLLGNDYDTNFSTLSYLWKLAMEAKSRAAVINRLTFGVPPKPAKAISKWSCHWEDPSSSASCNTFQNSKWWLFCKSGYRKHWFIKLVARLIIKTSHRDKVSSKSVLGCPLNPKWDGCITNCFNVMEVKQSQGSLPQQFAWKLHNQSLETNICLLTS